MMKKYAWLGLALMSSTLVMTGCEWEFGGSAENYNTSQHGWVNFSGMYRGVGGGSLVSDYSTDQEGASTVTNEKVGTANNVDEKYSGVLGQTPVIPGSVTIRLPSFTLSDDGASILSGNGVSGTINYNTGVWTVDLQGKVSSPGDILASYQTTAGVGGATGITIHTFNIVQDGSFLRFTDNNGSNYEGKLGRMTGTGGSEDPVAGDQVIAHYVVRGRSAAGRNVTMAGTFQGVVGGGGILSDRRLYGTWMEEGGRTGDINGQAAPIGVTASAN